MVLYEAIYFLSDVFLSALRLGMIDDDRLA